MLVLDSLSIEAGPSKGPDAKEEKIFADIKKDIKNLKTFKIEKGEFFPIIGGQVYGSL